MGHFSFTLVRLWPSVLDLHMMGKAFQVFKDDTSTQTFIEHFIMGLPPNTRSFHTLSLFNSYPMWSVSLFYKTEI